MALEAYHLRVVGARGDELLDAHGEYGRFAEAVDDDLRRRGGPPLPCLITFTSGRIIALERMNVASLCSCSINPLTCLTVMEMTTLPRGGGHIMRMSKGSRAQSTFPLVYHDRDWIRSL